MIYLKYRVAEGEERSVQINLLNLGRPDGNLNSNLNSLPHVNHGFILLFTIGKIH